MGIANSTMRIVSNTIVGDDLMRSVIIWVGIITVLSVVVLPIFETVFRRTPLVMTLLLFGLFIAGAVVVASD